mgnify:CR=1 FL=1
MWTVEVPHYPSTLHDRQHEERERERVDHEGVRMESQQRRVCTERERGRASPERKRGREGAVPELTHALYALYLIDMHTCKAEVRASSESISVTVRQRLSTPG